MAQVRVRNKNQITIPARIAESANIRPDDMLDISCRNGIVTLIPLTHRKKEKSAMSYAGIAQGAWGTSTEEIETELKKSRETWER